MDKQRIILLGTGSLATAIVYALAASGLHDLEIHLYSRTSSSASLLAAAGNKSASLSDNRQVFIPKQMDWESVSFLCDELEQIKPAFVIHTASFQSAWDLQHENKWSKLIRSIGYGGTLPLQYKLAGQVAKVCSQLENPPLFINCCYPDAVNYVLRHCGREVFCGIGNIGIIDFVLSLQKNPLQDYRMLANHFHLQELFRPAAEREEFPRLWIGEDELTGTRKQFDPIRIKNSPELNSITAQTCINLLKAVISRSDCVLHLPGPGGLAGGYPVHFSGGKIVYAGTKKLSSAEEQEWNEKILAREGLILNKTRIRFSEKAKKEIGIHSEELAAGIEYKDMDAYCDSFLQLKKFLSN